MLTILITENVPATIRGDLTRWLLELKPGVFAGNVTPRVRDRLWNRVCDHTRTGACWLLHESDNEQRMTITVHRDPERTLRDFEGLQLLERP